MWVQFRSMEGKTSYIMRSLSKLTKIETVRQKLDGEFGAPAHQLRLFFQGKQLEDAYTLFDYNVGLNNIVQVVVKEPETSKPQTPTKSPETSQQRGNIDKENEVTTSENGCSLEQVSVESRYFKVGSLVDAMDLQTGAWYEGKIVNIQRGRTVLDPKSEFANSVQSDKKEDAGDSGSITDDGLEYHVQFDDYAEDEPAKLQLRQIRPRAQTKMKVDDLKQNDVVMVNYNLDRPGERGHWYDGVVKSAKCHSTGKELIVDLLVGCDGVPFADCKITFVDEVYAIETNKVMATEGLTRSPEKESSLASRTPEASTSNEISCNSCRDIPTRKCMDCGCCKCGGKDNPDRQILCDDCDRAYHFICLTPPLSELPPDPEWYCPLCKTDTSEVVKAGEKLKESKKKAKMASSSSASTRDWGKGMACVGRTKECTIVPPNHFGAVPGVEVGTMWRFRVQASESGIHRPHVAGIHGREGEGAYSIVLSGGYEDDVDEGEQFKYTGSGGRDLSGNKRTAEQSSDQTLTRMNKALAMNCAAPINSKTGAEAKNWKEGKPVRVVRNCKGRKHSKFCPKEGNRYDGIYKVVKYWPEKGKSGFIVWRYLLKRDDPTPAPWTKAGEKRIQNLGLTMQYPDGYLADEKKTAKSQAGASKETKGKRSKDAGEKEEEAVSAKKFKGLSYQIPSDIQKLIAKDKNEKLWKELKTFQANGSQVFLKHVEELFACICCQELVYKPVTTDCKHNFCKDCLERSFKAEVFTCPACRHMLDKDVPLAVNDILQSILLKLFPGYDVGR